MNLNKLKISLNHALNGIIEAFVKENSFKIQVIATFIVVLLGTFVGLSLWKWSVLFLTISIILSLELVNTACEKIIDLLVKEHHPHIKYIKDILAGAVLISSFIALIIAVIIFII